MKPGLIHQMYRDIHTLQENLNEDFAGNLLSLTNKYIELYSENINRQVRRGYYVLLFFAVTGGLILCAGAVGALFFNLKENSYAVMVSGAITGFITTILFSLHNKNIKEMGLYRDKIIQIQKVAIALNAAQLLPDAEKSKSISEIIQFLLDGKDEK